MRASKDDSHRTLLAGTTLTALGAAGAATSVWLGAGPIPYLVALSVLSVGLLIVTRAALRTVRARRIGVALTALLVATAVLTPWRLAVLERSGNPQWTIVTAGLVSDIFSDGSRAFYMDDDGMHAVDLRDGTVLWSHELPGLPGGFDVATDGHVLARSVDAGRAQEASWISPEGEVLWSSSGAGDGGSEPTVDDRAFGEPVASSGGVLVVETCEDRADAATCRHLGIGTDGSERWSREGESRRPPTTMYSQHNLSYEYPREIPEVAVVHSGGDPDDGELVPAELVDAAEGTALATIDIGESVAVLGDTVVYESGPASAPGLCQMHGRSADGTVSWQRDAPCLSAGSVALGRWIYGTLESTADSEQAEKEIHESFAMDPSTGEWREVGPLAYFHARADARAGVPGTDVVVQRHDQQLTRVDPASGAVGWTLEVPGAESIPGVEAAHGAAAVLYRPGTGHNPFTAGDDRTHGMGVLAVDTRTGRVTGSLTTPTDVWSTTPVAPGQVLVSERDSLTLIGANPSR